MQFYLIQCLRTIKFGLVLQQLLHLTDMTDDERNKRADDIIAAGNAAVIDFEISFSDNDCAGYPWGKDWLAFTCGECYHRIKNAMLDCGLSEHDVKMIIASAWDDGWTRGNLK